MERSGAQCPGFRSSLYPLLALCLKDSSFSSLLDSLLCVHLIHHICWGQPVHSHACNDNFYATESQNFIPNSGVALEFHVGRLTWMSMNMSKIELAILPSWGPCPNEWYPITRIPCLTSWLIHLPPLPPNWSLFFKHNLFCFSPLVQSSITSCLDYRNND